MSSLSLAKHRLASALLASWLLLLGPRGARAENSLTYKYGDYRESGDRIVVETHNILIEQDLGTAMQLRVAGVIDAIAGASPNGQPAPAGSDQVVFSSLRDHRKAWSAEVSRQFPATTLGLGLANSRESDYVSTGWSVNTRTDFNRKNTTLLAGIAGAADKVQVFYRPEWAHKHTNDVVVGLTQLLSPLTSLSVNGTWGHSRGYLSDQYKVVQRSLEVAPGVFLPFTFGENRPEHRSRWIALVALNRSFPQLGGALEASYRFFHDSFGTDANTLELRWLQHIGRNLVLIPEVRLYGQSAAEFYHYRLDETSIVPQPGAPNPAGPFYSSDYRLSALRTTLYGLKAVWTIGGRWQLDVAYQHYHMKGTDAVTPPSAYPHAGILTVGGKFSW